MCVIISGVSSNRFLHSLSSSPTHQAFAASHKVESKTPSGEVCTLIQISYAEKEYKEIKGRHIIQVPVVVDNRDYLCQNKPTVFPTII